MSLFEQENGADQVPRRSTRRPRSSQRKRPRDGGEENDGNGEDDGARPPRKRAAPGAGPAENAGPRVVERAVPEARGEFQVTSYFSDEHHEKARKLRAESAAHQAAQQREHQAAQQRERRRDPDVAWSNAVALDSDRCLGKCGDSCYGDDCPYGVCQVADARVFASCAVGCDGAACSRGNCAGVAADARSSPRCGPYGFGVPLSEGDYERRAKKLELHHGNARGAKARDADGRTISPTSVAAFESLEALVNEVETCEALVCAVCHRLETQEEYEAEVLARLEEGAHSTDGQAVERRANYYAKKEFNNSFKRSVGACASCGLVVRPGIECAFDWAHHVGAEITKYIDSFFASGIINGWSAFDDAWKLHYFQYIARCRLLCANCHKRHDTDVANRRRTEERLARISGLGLWRM
ncbi:hypothetical protein JL720_494 [Aureococcus anophagefferens]|nr:hypothetical protein JL720_494 [Aureococcus anophagefferens]